MSDNYGFKHKTECDCLVKNSEIGSNICIYCNLPIAPPSGKDTLEGRVTELETLTSTLAGYFIPDNCKAPPSGEYCKCKYPSFKGDTYCKKCRKPVEAIK